jgi:hypothetical protein
MTPSDVSRSRVFGIFFVILPLTRGATHYTPKLLLPNTKSARDARPAPKMATSAKPKMAAGSRTPRSPRRAFAPAMRRSIRGDSATAAPARHGVVTCDAAKVAAHAPAILRTITPRLLPPALAAAAAGRMPTSTRAMPQRYHSTDIVVYDRARAAPRSPAARCGRSGSRSWSCSIMHNGNCCRPTADDSVDGRHGACERLRMLSDTMRGGGCSAAVATRWSPVWCMDAFVVVPSLTGAFPLLSDLLPRAPCQDRRSDVC